MTAIGSKTLVQAPFPPGMQIYCPIPNPAYVPGNPASKPFLDGYTTYSELLKSLSGPAAEVALLTTGLPPGFLVPDVGGSIVSKTVTGPFPGNYQYAAGSDVIALGDGFRVIEGESLEMTCAAGAGSGNLVLAASDFSKTAVALWMGGSWAVRLAVGGGVVAGVVVDAPQSAIPALAVNKATGQVKAWFDGRPVVTGPFAPGGLAADFFAGITLVRAAVVLGFQSPGTIAFRFPGNGMQMAYEYDGALDLLGNKAHTDRYSRVKAWDTTPVANTPVLELLPFPPESGFDNKLILLTDKTYILHGDPAASFTGGAVQLTADVSDGAFWFGWKPDALGAPGVISFAGHSLSLSASGIGDTAPATIQLNVTSGGLTYSLSAGPAQLADVDFVAGTHELLIHVNNPTETITLRTSNADVVIPAVALPPGAIPVLLNQLMVSGYGATMSGLISVDAADFATVTPLEGYPALEGRVVVLPAGIRTGDILDPIGVTPRKFDGFEYVPEEDYALVIDAQAGKLYPLPCLARLLPPTARWNDTLLTSVGTGGDHATLSALRSYIVREGIQGRELSVEILSPLSMLDSVVRLPGFEKVTLTNLVFSFTNSFDICAVNGQTVALHEPTINCSTFIGKDLDLGGYATVAASEIITINGLTTSDGLVSINSTDASGGATIRIEGCRTPAGMLRTTTNPVNSVLLSGHLDCALHEVTGKIGVVNAYGTLSVHGDPSVGHVIAGPLVSVSSGSNVNVQTVNTGLLTADYALAVDQGGIATVNGLGGATAAISTFNQAPNIPTGDGLILSHIPV